uniref:Baseplate wedge protein n=1 Tax=Siphoviridae sp. ctrgt10 TaxID=2826479 RepID=A0A8S5M6Y1_9CAUD|nr:MAG TPA: Baseplate wedge protein [Siphoviridae sp. ctrgt10]
MLSQDEKSLSNISFINKDFESLWSELLALVPKLTAKWNPSEANESDPLAVLLKLITVAQDKVNYNIDKNILELFPLSLTQQVSAFNVYDALGYNFEWYRSATSSAKQKNIAITCSSLPEDIKEKSSIKIPIFTQLSTDNNEIVYTLTKSIDFTAANQTEFADVVQGSCTDYLINNVDIITSANLDANNRLYFIESNVAENGVFICNYNKDWGSGAQPLDWTEWKKVDNLLTTQEDKVFKFGVDPTTNSCYIEFKSNIGETIGSGIHIKYVVSAGENGNLSVGKLNQFFNNLQLSYMNNENESKTVPANSYFTVFNNFPLTNGRNPKDLNETYEDYKRTVNVFNTLVSLLDYKQYLKDYTDDADNKRFSNVQVTDRTNDPRYTYKIKTLNKRYQFDTLTGNVTENNATHMDASDLRAYPLSASPSTSTRTGYDKTFEPITGETGTKVLEDAVASAKTIQHTFVENGVPIIVTYDIAGQIYLNTKVSAQEATEIRTNVLTALYSELEASKMDFGEQPDYKKVLDIITSADSRISYVALQPISNYKTENKGVLSTTEYSGRVNLTCRSILSGKTPWAVMRDENNTKTIANAYYDTFQVRLGQKDTSIKTFAPVFVEYFSTTSKSSQDFILQRAPVDKAHVKVFSLNGVEYTNITVTNSTVTVNFGASVPGAIEIRYGEAAAEDAVYAENLQSKVKFSASTNNQNRLLEIGPNEQINFITPLYRAEKTYANYLFFVATLDAEIPANTPHELSETESIKFYNTRQDITNNKVFDELKAGDKIQATFDLSPTTDTSNPPSVTTQNTIDKLTLVKYTPTNPVGDKFYCSSSALYKKLVYSGVNKYLTLSAGEYIIYVTTDNVFTIYGEGTSVITSSGFNSSKFAPYKEAGSLDLALYQQTNSVEVLSDYFISITDKNSYFSFISNKVLTFGEGYVFRFSNKAGTAQLTNKSWTELLNKTFPQSTFVLPQLLQNSQRIQYSLAASDKWTTLPEVLPTRITDSSGHSKDIVNWSFNISVSLSANKETPQVCQEFVATVEEDKANAVKHTQGLFYTTLDKQVEQLSSSTTWPNYINSSAAIASYGASVPVDTSLSLCLYTVQNDTLWKNNSFVEISKSTYDTITTPNVSGLYYIIPYYIGDDIKYMLSSPGATPFSTFTAPTIYIGKAVCIDANCYVYSPVVSPKYKKLSEVLAGLSGQPDSVILSDSSSSYLRLISQNYSYIYVPMSSEEILNPEDEVSFFNENSPVNSVTIAKLGSTDNLQISPLSLS